LSFPEPEVPKRISEVTPSMVFEMFNEGRRPIDVVIETDGDPTKINEWHKVWLEMGGRQEEYWAKWKGKELDRYARETLDELKELLGTDSVELQGKSPSGLKAALFYMLAREEGLSASQSSIAAGYGVAEQTAYRNRRFLERLMKEKRLKLTARHYEFIAEREVEGKT